VAARCHEADYGERIRRGIGREAVENKEWTCAGLYLRTAFRTDDS
jgi:hypothetical protein